MNKSKVDPRRIGVAKNFTLTDAQIAWIESKQRPGMSRCEALRKILDDAMRQERVKNYVISKMKSEVAKR
jgi:hypothetical protein